MIGAAQVMGRLKHPMEIWLVSSEPIRVGMNNAWGFRFWRKTPENARLA